MYSMTSRALSGGPGSASSLDSTRTSAMTREVFGLSDRDVENFSFESWVRDLETVVDALGLERFDLLGSSQGGPVSIAYAVRHPERVSHLVLGGAFAKGWEHWNLEPGQLELIRAMVTIMKNGWGRDDPFARRVFTDAFLPESTPDQPALVRRPPTRLMHARDRVAVDGGGRQSQHRRSSPQTDRPNASSTLEGRRS